jgi:uncharacterized protein YegL
MSRPGGQLAALPLHFVWIADCSGSMSADGKMAALNHAAREALPQMRKVANDNPNAAVFVRLLRFSTGASWVVDKPTPLQYFQWPELTATPGGMTDLGAALGLLARELRTDVMPGRALPPVLALLTDGYPTDHFEAGLDALMQEPWGAKATRIGISIGSRADSDVIRRFIGNPKIAPLRARNADELLRFVRWASTNVMEAVSSPRAGTPGDPGLRPPFDRAEIVQGTTW